LSYFILFGWQIDTEALLQLDEPLYQAGHLQLIFAQLMQTVPTDFLFSDKVFSSCCALFLISQPRLFYTARKQRWHLSGRR
jgi:hypothetical protein